MSAQDVLASVDSAPQRRRTKGSGNSREKVKEVDQPSVGILENGLTVSLTGGDACTFANGTAGVKCQGPDACNGNRDNIGCGSCIG